jgi:hypothetical protein
MTFCCYTDGSPIRILHQLVNYCGNFIRRKEESNKIKVVGTNSINILRHTERVLENKGYEQNAEKKVT